MTNDVKQNQDIVIKYRVKKERKKDQLAIDRNDHNSHIQQIKQATFNRKTPRSKYSS